MSNMCSSELVAPVDDEYWLAPAAQILTEGIGPDEPEDPGPGAVVDGSEVLARIGLLERQIAMAQGEQVAAPAEWVSGARARYAARRPDWINQRRWERSVAAEWAERSAYAEVALELGLADRTSDARVRVAVDLVERLPAAVAAMRAGWITLAKARVVLEETVNLDADRRAGVESQMLDKAPGMTPGNLRRATRRAVTRIDPDAARGRRKAAHAERSVRMWEIGDGMSALHAVLPTEAAQAAFGVINATAQAALVPGDQRSIDAARADVFVDLLCFPPELDARISYQIQIISPDPDPDPDPDLDAEPTRRHPNAAQARWIKARDQHCRHPGCRRVAGEDDHTIAH
jgi:hypothetical protein